MMTMETLKGSLGERRQAEFAKYNRAYEAIGYKMKTLRRDQTTAVLEKLPQRGSYLDVGCGRGEMLTVARSLGFEPCTGTEIVEALYRDKPDRYYAEVHALPFESKMFYASSLLDVIEHLIPGDDELACKELMRVTFGAVIITANNKESRNHAGEQLHINRRPYGEWHDLFSRWFAPAAVTWLDVPGAVSQFYRVDL